MWKTKLATLSAFELELNVYISFIRSLIQPLLMNAVASARISMGWLVMHFATDCKLH